MFAVRYFIFLLLFVVLGSEAFSKEKLLTLSNKEGQEIKCTITGFYNGKLTLKRDDGRVFKYDYDLLDDASKDVARNAVIGIFPASIDVRSLFTSSRESKSYDMFGTEYRKGTKERRFGVKVKTFCPFEVDVVADCFFYNGSSWGRKKIKGVCKDDSIWEFEVGDKTSWMAIQYNSFRTMGRSTDSKSGSSRIDLVIFLRSSDGEILDQYATSRYAEQQIEENIILKNL
ncbi:hypothetical protein [Cerasicoccus maritimus]|uniref:hypothetical protein n=1 Tax=Cerasicoccus maritimus TaxID=490089 RepID=UPI002852512B|nr:hypothetical protein [Cerasicoccus maritimus]